LGGDGCCTFGGDAASACPLVIEMFETIKMVDVMLPTTLQSIRPVAKPLVLQPVDKIGHFPLSA
jgi:hypothetical protein